MSHSAYFRRTAMRALPFVLSLLLTACATYPTVQTDFDPTANFASYRNYSWLPAEVPRGMNPLMFRRVQGAIDRALKARGYAETNPADFAIAFTIVHKDRTEIHSYPDYWGGWGYWGWGGWGWGGWGYPYSPNVDSYTVTERSIVIDIYDAKTHYAVWHGVVSKDAYSDEVDYAKLDEAVNAVLSRFPPPVAPPAPPPQGS
jgi:hypothetical protein